mgnify:CR=1 FL=1
MHGRHSRTSLHAILISLVLVVVAVGVAYAAIVGIDSFAEGPQSITADDDAPTNSETTGPHSSIIGGYRHLFLGWTEGTKEDAVSLDVDTSASAQTLGYSSKSG